VKTCIAVAAMAGRAAALGKTAGGGTWAPRRSVWLMGGGGCCVGRWDVRSNGTACGGENHGSRWGAPPQTPVRALRRSGPRGRGVTRGGVRMCDALNHWRTRSGILVIRRTPGSLRSGGRGDPGVRR
jgi:hypothetical protein